MPVARSLPSDLTGSVTSVRIASKAAKAAKAAIGYLEPAGPLAREDVVRELTFTARTFAAEEGSPTASPRDWKRTAGQRL
jgi:hypothetical protein